MAEVFLARRRAGGVEKLLVIKRIRAERASDARFLELFVREARLSMSLTHQNIVPVFDFGRIGDQVFLAMERIEGKDLGSTLARSAPLPTVVAAFIAAECCRALAYAHLRRRDGEHLGVVHRDVTPRNVLLSWSGEVKLTDFGVAAVTGEQTGHLVGTPAYMAPEQARGESVDARADLYAVGMILREAATGARARPGADRTALVEAARRNELAPWPANCPAPLVAIADRATASSPADRYPDARAMLAALDEYIVAERAVRAGEPPDRQLADWLARAWEGEREDAAEAVAEHPDVVSLFDDAGIGSGTERSLAATADEPRIEPRVHPRRSRWRSVAAIAGITAIGLVTLVVGRCEQHAGESSPDAVVTAVDAQPADAYVAIASDASAPDAVAIEAPPSDASVPDAAVIEAPPIDASIATRAPRHAPTNMAHDAASLDARVVITRKVRINARPWATFTVDSGTTQYETISTIELAPGRHTIHFSNPQLGVERDVSIEVPNDRDIDHVEDLRR